MNLAIIIVSWNVRDLLAACLRSLFEDLARSHIKAEVWVVDNASADGSPQMVAEEFPQVRLIASQENLGFAAGNNLALREVGIRNCEKPNGQIVIPNSQFATHNSQPATRNSQFVWLLNPDTEVRPGAATALMSALETHPSVGIVGAKLLYGDGSLQHSAFRFPGLLQLLFELFPIPARLYETRLNGRYPRHLYDGTAPFPIDHPLGASMMVRSETIMEVGLLDEDFFMYGEDIDWCYRIKTRGWKIIYYSQARILHHKGGSGASPKLLREFYRSMYLFYCFQEVFWD